MAHVSSYRAREGPARDREHRAAAGGDSPTANFSDTVTDSNNVQPTLASRKVTSEPEFVLATEPPTLEQRRLALIVVAVLFVVFAVTVAIGRTSAFALVPFRIDAFVPFLVALLFVNDFITATLLFGQFAAQLGVAEVTVKFHRSSLMRKMNARSVAELARMAEILGIAHPKP